MMEAGARGATTDSVSPAVHPPSIEIDAFSRVLFSKSVKRSGEKIAALAAPPARSRNTGAYALPGFVTLESSTAGA